MKGSCDHNLALHLQSSAGLADNWNCIPVLNNSSAHVFLPGRHDCNSQTQTCLRKFLIFCFPHAFSSICIIIDIQHHCITTQQFYILLKSQLLRFIDFLNFYVSQLHLNSLLKLITGLLIPACIQWKSPLRLLSPPEKFGICLCMCT